MNQEIYCITNEGKTAKNEWENDLPCDGVKFFNQ